MKQTILSVFSSLKLTIALLIIIAVASILGTIIPQQYDGGESLSRLNPALMKAFKSLQLFDMYHSVWFVILMGLLSVNLIACSLNRFPASWKLFKKIPSVDRGKPLDNLRPERTLTIEAGLDQAIMKVDELLRGRYRRMRRKDTTGTAHFYADKGGYSRFGVYIIHASALTVIAGAIVGSLLGFEGSVNIPEGESTDMVNLRRQEGTRKLEFSVRCDKFSITYYDNGMPKEYRSDLTFHKDNEVIYQGRLLVNHPITVEGIRFYQASYGTVPGGRAYITIQRGTEEETTIPVEVGSSFYLREQEATVTVERIEDNFMSMGTAVLLGIQSAQGKMRIWIFKEIEGIQKRIPWLLKKAPIFNPGLLEPYYFKLNEVEARYYTGLQVGRDPGVPIVAMGSLVIIAGFFITFFSSHRRVWIKVDGQGQRTRITVSATSNRDPVGLERETGRLLRRLKEAS